MAVFKDWIPNDDASRVEIALEFLDERERGSRKWLVEIGVTLNSSDRVRDRCQLKSEFVGEAVLFFHATTTSHKHVAPRMPQRTGVPAHTVHSPTDDVSKRVLCSP